MIFFERVRALQEKNQTLLCVGLDPDIQKFPSGIPQSPEAIFEFNRAIIDATADLVCCAKPNIAFYEQYGRRGLEALEKSIGYIRDKQIPLILDAKRADIGNTSAAYARAIFDVWQADATTVNPYFGLESIESFLKYSDKGIFVLCLTSSLVEDEFTKKDIGKPIFVEIAKHSVEWNHQGNVGLVVAANQADRMEQVRRAAPGIPFLIPGLGTQGGVLQAAVKFGTEDGSLAIINASRSILYASSGTDFAQAARQEALRIRQAIGNTQPI